LRLDARLSFPRHRIFSFPFSRLRILCLLDSAPSSPFCPSRVEFPPYLNLSSARLTFDEPLVPTDPCRSAWIASKVCTVASIRPRIVPPEFAVSLSMVRQSSAIPLMLPLSAKVNRLFLRCFGIFRQLLLRYEHCLRSWPCSIVFWTEPPQFELLPMR